MPSRQTDGTILQPIGIKSQTIIYKLINRKKKLKYTCNWVIGLCVCVVQLHVLLNYYVIVAVYLLFWIDPVIAVVLPYEHQNPSGVSPILKEEEKVTTTP